MNISSFHMSQETKRKLFDTIEVISPNPRAQNTITTAAQLCDTIPYTILTGIDPKLKRVIQRSID